MAIYNWLARAGATFDLWTNTIGGSILVGDVFRITRNGRTVSFTATAATVANVTAGLAAACAASVFAEFLEYTWTSTTTTVIGTANTAGVPGTFTVSKTSTSGTTSITNTTAATGPNNWNDANNWDQAAVPGTGDTANVNLDLGSVLDGFAQSGVTLAALNIFGNDQSKQLGRKRINPANYTEDRALALHIGATAVRVDCAAKIIKLKIATATTVEARRTGSSGGESTNSPALQLQGGDNTSVVESDQASVGLAYYQDETFDAATVRIGSSGSVLAGSGATIVTWQNLGSLDTSGAWTTLNQFGKTAIIRGAPGATTITGTGGTIDCRIGGTLTNLSLRNCTLDKSNDLTPLTITNTTENPGSVIIDPYQSITHTNEPVRGAGVRERRAA